MASDGAPRDRDPCRIDPRDEAQLPIVTRWLELTAWLMGRTADMPKKWRPSLVQRLEAEALEVLTLLTEAGYRRRKLGLLRNANIHLSRLRMLLELAHRLEALSHGSHEHALVAIDDVGRMLGGWTRSVAERERK